MSGIKRLLKVIWDFIGIPFRLVLFDQKWLPFFCWTTLEDDRLNAVLPHIRGKLLDIGAGTNTLVQKYKSGIGVDIHDWGGGAVVVSDTSDLPWEAGSFDTVTFVACLNHIPYREKAVREAFRLLSAGGVVIVTMINPILGGIGHKIWWYSEDKHRGGMLEGEVGGMWNSDIKKIFADTGFRLVKESTFVYGMNNLLIFQK